LSCRHSASRSWRRGVTALSNALSTVGSPTMISAAWLPLSSEVASLSSLRESCPKPSSSGMTRIRGRSIRLTIWGLPFSLSTTAASNFQPSRPREAGRGRRGQPLQIPRYRKQRSVCDLCCMPTNETKKVEPPRAEGPAVSVVRRCTLARIPEASLSAESRI
jgi:hypothetical protein